MRKSQYLLLGAALVLGLAGCNRRDDDNDSGGQDAAVDDSGPGDAMQQGQGTCSNPINLETAGTRMGDSLVYTGSTAGAENNLHPYGGCVMRDDSEIVLQYQVPAGVQALRLSTQGSDYNTVLYVRVACSQVPGGTDLACNNDSYDNAPQSTLYLTNVTPGQVLFVVVDGNADMGATGGSTGAFTLSVTPVPLGTRGNPCRPAETMGARCDGQLRCSEGGASDGTAICVPTVANGQRCDERGFDNTCVQGSRCVTDPTPQDGVPNDPVCAPAGTRAGAECRMSEPRCDPPLTCGSGEQPRCVRQLALGQPCDPTGTANRCAPPLVCGPLGDGGPAICHSPTQTQP